MERIKALFWALLHLFIVMLAVILSPLIVASAVLVDKQGFDFAVNETAKTIKRGFKLAVEDFKGVIR